MQLAILVIALGMAASSQNAPVTLPVGVKAVSFGQAQRYQGAGKEMCAIVHPVPSPAAFEHGVMEISYAVALEAGTVKSASARVVAPAGQELRAVPCNIFTPIKGGFSQTQLGSSISRIDKAPLRSGQYTLRITVDGQTASVPFTIK
jgi:hypothetical protein